MRCPSIRLYFNLFFSSFLSIAIPRGKNGPSQCAILTEWWPELNLPKCIIFKRFCPTSKPHRLFFCGQTDAGWEREDFAGNIYEGENDDEQDDNKMKNKLEFNSRISQLKPPFCSYSTQQLVFSLFFIAFLSEWHKRDLLLFFIIIIINKTGSSSPWLYIISLKDRHKIYYVAGDAYI